MLTGPRPVETKLNYADVWYYTLYISTSKKVLHGRCMLCSRLRRICSRLRLNKIEIGLRTKQSIVNCAISYNRAESLEIRQTSENFPKAGWNEKNSCNIQSYQVRTSRIQPFFCFNCQSGIRFNCQERHTNV